MPVEYHIVRTDQMTQAVNTYAPIESDAGGGTPGPIRVPSNVSRLKMMRVGLANSAPLGTDSGAAFALRLTGPALRDGQQDFALSGLTNNLETTGAGGFAILQSPPQEIHCGIAVIPGNDLNLSASYIGVDVGTPEIVVECVFE